MATTAPSTPSTPKTPPTFHRDDAELAEFGYRPESSRFREGAEWGKARRRRRCAQPSVFTMEAAAYTM